MPQLLPPMPVGMSPDSSFWNDWYEKLRLLVNSLSSSIDWNIITNKPTTLAGYGITDAQTKLNNSAGLAAALSDETGTGLAVFNTSPTLVTPNIGAATATTIMSSGNITISKAGESRLLLNDTATFGYNFNTSHTSTGAGYGSIGRTGLGTLMAWDSAGNFRIGTSVVPTGTWKLQLDGSLRISSGTMISTATSFTNGAGASAGTLTNAPTAGNPTKWIPIDDNGTTRYIPAW